MFRAGPQLRGSCGSVPRRTSTARVAWQCSPLNLNREGPWQRCRWTSTASFDRQCSPPELNREFCWAVFPTGHQPRASAGSVPRRTSTVSSITATSTQSQTQPQAQSQAQPQTHNHKTQPQHTTTKHNHNTHNHKDTSKPHNHSTQPEDPQAKSRITKVTTRATCSSPWHEDK